MYEKSNATPPYLVPSNEPAHWDLDPFKEGRPDARNIAIAVEAAFRCAPRRKRRLKQASRQDPLSVLTHAVHDKLREHGHTVQNQQDLNQLARDCLAEAVGNLAEDMNTQSEQEPVPTSGRRKRETYHNKPPRMRGGRNAA